MMKISIFGVMFYIFFLINQARNIRNRLVTGFVTGFFLINQARNIRNRLCARIREAIKI